MVNFVSSNILLLMILLPIAVGAITWLVRKSYAVMLLITVLYSAANLLMALVLYTSPIVYVTIPFASFGLDIAFSTGKYSALFLVFAAVGLLLTGIYSVSFLKDKVYSGRFMLYMFISISMINGALLSDNLGIMLFFWEGLLCTLAGILLIGNKSNPKTAVKALALSGTADLLLMLGIIITGQQAGTLYISGIEKLPVVGVSGLGFILMMLGALGKAGCMPFHTWIPSAAEDAPTPFLAAFPGTFEKLLGIYLAVRLTTDIYDLQPGSTMSTVIMVIGVLTIIFAVAMALIQKDMKRLLSYHAISQVGYMVLGIGSALPIGIVGGVFHMVNNVLYKSSLFMVAGSIEKQTGTTDLRQLGGLGKKMPVTMICFVICGLAIAGVPPFNGFFSKELIFDAALESHFILYAGALLGAFMTAVSFLKMGRAAFFGTPKVPEGKNVDSVRESGIGILLPMSVLAALCVIFGVANTLPLDRLLQPALGFTGSFSGWPHSAVLVIVSVVVLILAVADHVYGSIKSGSAVNAADHIHYAPVLRHIYSAAERGMFDPYNLLMHVVNLYSALCVNIERGVSWFYDVAIVRAVKGAGDVLRSANEGTLAQYLSLALMGVLGIVAIFFLVL